MQTIEILKAITEQLASPVRDGCNSESSFVKTKLERQGLKDAALAYWNWVCMPSTRPAWATEEIIAAQQMLDALKKKVAMPAWGTYGT